MIDPDRRGALTLVAGIGVAASGLVLAGCAKSGGGHEEEGGKVTANEDLMREHGVLRRILVVYREIAPRIATGAPAIDAKAIGQAAALFRDFGEHYHEQILEEQNIFPILRKAGGEAAGLVDTLVAQHARGRQITDFITERTRTGSIASGDGGALAQAMSSFCRMYEAHTAREDTLIFPAFKKAVGEKEYDALGEQFEDIERRMFGGDGFDMALDKVEAIERALGVADLTRFTAPSPPASGASQPGAA